MSPTRSPPRWLRRSRCRCPPRTSKSAPDMAAGTARWSAPCWPASRPAARWRRSPPGVKPVYWRRHPAAGSPVRAWLSVAGSGEGEVGQAAEPGDGAVDGERGEGTGLEVAKQEADGQVGADAGEQASGQDLAADAVAERPGQIGDLECAGGEDDGGGEQEREPGGVLVGQAAGQASDHGDPGAADTGEQGEDLRGADEHGLGVAEAGQPPV